MGKASDVNVLVKKKVNEPYDKFYEKAKAAHDNGKLKLVSEKILQPFNGYGFELKKGQTIRYELTDGPQIIDTEYLVKSRPKEEWADVYNTTTFGAMTPYEGIHYYSNTPYNRPLLTIIKDTVDNEKLKKMYGDYAAHSFIWNSARCTEATWEALFGVPNCNSCNSNLYKGIIEVAGEEVARSIKNPQVYMHFQPIDFLMLPHNIQYYPGGNFRDGPFKKGDYVELLAHDDLYVSVSLCPVGDQNNWGKFDDFTCYPIRVAIYEGADGPLETAPDPQNKSEEAVNYVKAGRPGMTVGKIGESQS